MTYVFFPALSRIEHTHARYQQSLLPPKGALPLLFKHTSAHHRPNAINIFFLVRWWVGGCGLVASRLNTIRRNYCGDISIPHSHAPAVARLPTNWLNGFWAVRAASDGTWCNRLRHQRQNDPFRGIYTHESCASLVQAKRTYLRTRRIPLLAYPYTLVHTRCMYYACFCVGVYNSYILAPAQWKHDGACGGGRHGADSSSASSPSPSSASSSSSVVCAFSDAARYILALAAGNVCACVCASVFAGAGDLGGGEPPRQTAGQRGCIMPWTGRVFGVVRVAAARRPAQGTGRARKARPERSGAERGGGRFGAGWMEKT